MILKMNSAIMNSENGVLTNETTYKDTFDASFSFIAIFCSRFRLISDLQPLHYALECLIEGELE